MMGRIIATIHRMLDDLARWREVAFNGEAARLADRLLPLGCLMFLLAVFVVLVVADYIFFRA